MSVQFRKIVELGFNWIKSQLEKIWRNKNLNIFVIFLALSTSFWLLNALRKTYTTTIHYPIRFINLPKNKMLSQDVPRYLALEIKGGGFSLLRYKFSNKFFPFAVDYADMHRFGNAQKRGAFLLTNEYKTKISGQLSQDIEMISVKPDTLVIGLMNRKTVTLPVVPKVDIQFNDQFKQSGIISVDPPEIDVSGPDEIVDTLKFIPTESSAFSDIKDSIRYSLKLEEFPELEYSIDEVNVIIPVESYTESKIKVPIEIRGVPQGYYVKTFPSEVDVSCMVALGQYEQINDKYFVATIDVTGMELSSQSKLKVKLETVPQFVYSIKYEPLFVDFLIERSY